MTESKIFKEFLKQYPHVIGTNIIAWRDAQERVRIMIEKDKYPYCIVGRYIAEETKDGVIVTKL